MLTPEDKAEIKALLAEALRERDERLLAALKDAHKKVRIRAGISEILQEPARQYLELLATILGQTLRSPAPQPEKEGR